VSSILAAKRDATGIEHGEEDLGLAGCILPGLEVLNALRHHGEEDWAIEDEEPAYGWCSTPCGITAKRTTWYETEDGVWVAVLNAQQAR
jgi:hypothetical protein